MSYDTSDGSATPLLASTSITPIQIQSGIDAVIAGSVASDQSGTLTISQSFDGSNWDISQNIAVAGGAPQGFNVNIIAPFTQVSYTNGGTNQTYMRLFARAFGNRSN